MSALIFTSIIIYGLLNLVYLSANLISLIPETQKIVSNFSIGILIANGKCLPGNEEIPLTISFLCSKSKLLNWSNSRLEREHQARYDFHLRDVLFRSTVLFILYIEGWLSFTKLWIFISLQFFLLNLAGLPHDFYL